eukprot:NODE_1_length_95616_cov_0.657642.p59 type:complete len:180 gc:universal NODE_1_length_95616_cov_0.657642:40931-40392(-)
MQFFKYNFVPNSLNRVRGELKAKKLIWTDEHDDYTFTIDKEIHPKNEYVLLRSKKTGIYKLKKIEVSRTMRYDRNIKKTISSFPKFPDNLESKSQHISNSSPSLSVNDVIESSSFDTSYTKESVRDITTENIASKELLTVQSAEQNFGDFSNELDDEIELALTERDNESPKSLNSMYND